MLLIEFLKLIKKNEKVIERELQKNGFDDGLYLFYKYLEFIKDKYSKIDRGIQVTDEDSLYIFNDFLSNLTTKYHNLTKLLKNNKCNECLYLIIIFDILKKDHHYRLELDRYYMSIQNEINSFSNKLKTDVQDINIIEDTSFIDESLDF